jgi:glycosyl transferase family 87
MNNSSRPARLLGLACVGLGSLMLLLWAGAIAQHASSSMVDFRAFYFGSRILLQGGDPFDALQATRLGESEGARSIETEVELPNEFTFLYLPSALVVSSPVAFLSWHSAQVAWMLLNGGILIVAAFLMWELGADYAPLLSGILLGVFLANSESLLFQGNISGIVVGLCLIGAWCFLRNRFGLIGVLCLAISLVIKPHDSGFVWLFFLIGGGPYRKRALQTLLVAVGLGLGSLLWMGHVAPNWIHELRSNIAATTVRGAANDPGPTSATPNMVNSAINLQTILAVAWNEPGFYNIASILLCGALLLFWFLLTIRTPATWPRSLIALAFLSAFTMLPVYHRHHDGKLLMLAVPGCAILFAERRRVGLLAVLFTTLALALNADIPRVLLTKWEQNVAFSVATFSGKLMTILLGRPASLAVLAMAIFYLCSYWRTKISPAPSQTENSATVGAVT